MPVVKAFLEHLDKFFQFHEHLVAACLPPVNAHLGTTGLCEISSWTQQRPSSVLSAAAVPILQSSTCSSGYVCAGTLTDSLECQISLGTPLVCAVGDRANIIGLLSQEPNCDGPHRPPSNQFIEVSRYSQWITDRLKL